MEHERGDYTVCVLVTDPSYTLAALPWDVFRRTGLLGISMSPIKILPGHFYGATGFHSWVGTGASKREHSASSAREQRCRKVW